MCGGAGTALGRSSDPGMTGILVGSLPSFPDCGAESTDNGKLLLEWQFRSWSWVLSGGEGSSLRYFWLVFHSMKPPSHKMGESLSGPQYSQYAAPKGEPSFHNKGWIEEESSHISTVLATDFASAIVSWGQDENYKSPATPERKPSC